MQLRDGRFGELAQRRVKNDLSSALARCMKNCTVLDPHGKHFFETKRLRAKLRIIVIEFSAFALFVFDREERAVRALFNDVAFSGET